ncbi:MAG TPA: VOC family protein [Nocardioides sp.]
MSAHFSQLDDRSPAGKNRMHLDLVVPGGAIDAEAERLVAAGATLVGERREGDFRWITLADPDGNQFCIAEV